MNESEPLMRCRESATFCQKPLSHVSGERVRMLSAYCPHGRRHSGGMIIIQALLCNLGNLHCHAKGNAQWAQPKGRMPKGAAGDGLLRSSDEIAVMAVERRGQVIQYHCANQLLF